MNTENIEPSQAVTTFHRLETPVNNASKKGGVRVVKRRKAVCGVMTEDFSRHVPGPEKLFKNYRSSSVACEECYSNAAQFTRKVLKLNQMKMQCSVKNCSAVSQAARVIHEKSFTPFCTEHVNTREAKKALYLNESGSPAWEYYLDKLRLKKQKEEP